MFFINNLINLFVSPSRLFETIRKRSNWKDILVPFAILVVLGVLSMGLLKDLLIEVQLSRAVSRIENDSRIPVEKKDEFILRIEDRFTNPTPFMKTIAWVNAGLSIPIRVLFMALVLMVIGNAMFGGAVPYGKLVHMSAYVYLVNIVEQAVKVPLMLSRWSVEVYTGLGLLGLGEKGSFLHNFLAGMDFFAFWRIVLLAIGMGILYQRETKSFLWALIVFWMLQLALLAGLNMVAYS
ncbi:MAG: hypothetical protein GXO92_08105 [FCB group bacterium]|nr:hypothetical protein [FCB group bacterium]